MRRGVKVVSCLGAVWVLGAACTGVVGDPTGNRKACEEYVVHMNLLERCMGVRYDADNLCEGVERTPVDMTGYYECLRQHTSCDGEQARLDVDGCVPPLLVQAD